MFFNKLFEINFICQYLAKVLPIDAFIELFALLKKNILFSFVMERFLKIFKIIEFFNVFF